MLFQTITFFQSVSPSTFFFGTVWDPRFAAAGSAGSQGQFGLIPCSPARFISRSLPCSSPSRWACSAAIYMAEYASRSVRSVVKPLLEVLAGIPTIVYGFFALVTVGPFLRDLSAALSGGYAFIQAQSVLTAGIVMGVMLIPFVSSLSDDIITAVPDRCAMDRWVLVRPRRKQSAVLSSGSLAGHRRRAAFDRVARHRRDDDRCAGSRRCRQPQHQSFRSDDDNHRQDRQSVDGRSRVQFTANPGGFALGLTLFFITLAMNIFALYIVRKYREQYE